VNFVTLHNIGVTGDSMEQYTD